jgi:hypothetical protein
MPRDMWFHDQRGRISNDGAIRRPRDPRPVW